MVNENLITVGSLTSFLLYAAYVGISISGYYIPLFYKFSTIDTVEPQLSEVMGLIFWKMKIFGQLICFLTLDSHVLHFL